MCLYHSHKNGQNRRSHSGRYTKFSYIHWTWSIGLTFPAAVILVGFLKPYLAPSSQHSYWVSNKLISPTFVLDTFSIDTLSSQFYVPPSWTQKWSAHKILFSQVIHMPSNKVQLIIELDYLLYSLINEMEGWWWRRRKALGRSIFTSLTAVGTCWLQRQT